MKSVSARVMIVAILLAAPAHAADPPTPAELSEILAKNCDALRKEFKKPPAPAVPGGQCTEATPPEKLKACREALIKISTVAFAGVPEIPKVDAIPAVAAAPGVPATPAVAEKPAVPAIPGVADLIDTQNLGLKNRFTDSKIMQRLHVVLGGRKGEFEQVVRKAATAAYADFKAPAAPATLLDAAKTKILEVEETIGEGLFEACIAGDAAIIKAVFPSALTVAEQATVSSQMARDVVDRAEKDAFAEFTKKEGFTRSVECLWVAPVENTTTRSTLTCNPGLLLSGEEVSEILIKGVPAGQTVRVIAMHAEELETDLTEATSCSPVGKNLSCDEMIIGAHEPRPLLIAVHTMRWLHPTWGGSFGRTSSAEAALRKEGRTKLSLVTDGAPATIAVGVTVGADFASDSVPVGYARWKIESGGFFSISNQVDHEVMTEPGTGEKLRIIGVRDSDHVVQDSGIFVNFIPQNYQALGASLGFATPSNRRMSVFLGPSVRLKTFGNRGLASLAAGLAMRSVLRFPDATFNREVDADSAVLKGEEGFRFGWFVAVNLGFRIGNFGPQDEGDGN